MHGLTGIPKSEEHKVRMREGRKKRKSLGPINRSAVISMYEDGMILKEIAEKVNAHLSSIHYIIKKSGIERRTCNANRKTKSGHSFKRGINNHGYVYTKKPGHPRSVKNGWVREHIVVAENKIGRNISKKEHVHHINMIKDDNRPENLLVLSCSEHMKIHRRGVA